LRAPECTILRAQPACGGRRIVAVTSSVQRRRYRSTSIRDQLADLTGNGEDHISAVAQHSGADERGRTLLGSVVAGIRFEAEISFPKIMRLAVSRCDFVGIACNGKRFAQANISGFPLLVW
jgi:hypothetical protein